MKSDFTVSTATLAAALQLSLNLIHRLDDKKLLSTNYPETDTNMNDAVMCGQLATALMVKLGDSHV